jgi:hypothetical protein
MKTSSRTPLSFFEDLIVNDNLTIFKRRFIDNKLEFFNYDESIVKNFDYEKGIIEYESVAQGQFPNEVIEIIKTENYLNELFLIFRREIEKSKALIDESYIKYNDLEFKKFCFLQLNAANYIIHKSYKLINRNLFLLKPLEDIISYINERYLQNEDNYLKINKSKIVTKTLNNTVFNNDAEKVNYYLEYLKEYNDSGKKIMDDKSYELLIKSITDFLSTNEVPEFKCQIKINVPNNLLRFNFGLLHHALFGSQEIKEDYVWLLKSLIENFNKTQFSTLKNRIQNKDGITYKNKKYLPNFIKEALKE